MFKKTLIIQFCIIFAMLSTITFGYSKAELDSAVFLSDLGIIVKQEENLDNYKLDENVLRQEIAAVVMGLSCSEPKITCENRFNDITSTKPNNWACQTAETLLDEGLIAYNLNFRPESNISKAEAIGMIVKAVYGNEYEYNPKLASTWQYQVVRFAVDKGIVENFSDYDSNATRGFVFKAASIAVSRAGKTCEYWNILNRETTKDDEIIDPNKPKEENEKKCPPGYFLSGSNCYPLYPEEEDKDPDKSCTSTTINGYKVPDLRHNQYVNIDKNVEILYGTRTHTQRFLCTDGIVDKIGQEIIGYADCRSGEKRDPSDPTICLYTPPAGGGSRNPIGACGTDSGTGTVFNPTNLCKLGTPSHPIASNHVRNWTCNAITCSAPEAYCAEIDADPESNILYTIGTPTEQGQAWVKSTGLETACYYTCKPGYTGENCEDLVPISELFALNIPAVKHYVSDGVVAITDGTGTGYVIQDKNMGAVNVFPSLEKCSSYSSEVAECGEGYMGKYFQWGNNNPFSREITSTGTGQIDTSAYSGSTYYNSGSFIIENTDWSLTQNDSLWEMGTQGPCPSGYHIPTIAEWKGVINSLQDKSATAIINQLYLPMAGYINYENGEMYSSSLTSIGKYWTSSPNATQTLIFEIQSGTFSSENSSDRAMGNSLRCFKNGY